MTTGRYLFAEFILDERRHELLHRGLPVRLAPQPFRLLAALVARKGELVRREELGRALWSEGTFVDAEAGINFSVRTLRRALAELAGDLVLIETVPRLGYRLGVDVVELEADGIDGGATAPSFERDPRPPVASVATPHPDVDREPRGRSGARYVASGLGIAATLGLLAFLVVGSRRATSAPSDLALAVSGDGRPECEAIARAFEAEVSAVLLEGAEGRGELYLDGSAPPGVASRLEVELFAIPAGIRGDFRLLAGEPRAIVWQWSVELERERWFYGRSTLAEGVGRAVARRTWPPARAAAPLDPELAARLERARSRLDAREPGAAAAVVAELEPLLAATPQLAAPQALLARARLGLWDREGAERAARRALELDPELADGAMALASALSAQGRHAEALETAFRARKLAPLEPLVQIGLARALLFAGRAQQVVQATDAGLALLPELSPLWRWRYLAFVELGDAAKAGEALAKTLRYASGGAGRAVETALAGATLDTLRDEWRSELDGSRGVVVRSAYSRASLYALLGEPDAALTELERAIAAHEESAVFLSVAPWFGALRGDPRFQELVRRIEQEGEWTGSSTLDPDPRRAS